MAESRVVCCCTAATWAVVIAWLQIILNSIDAIFIVVAMTGAAFINFDDKDHKGEVKAAVMALLALFLIIYIVAIAFGVLLLRGANQRRPSFLRAWLVYAVILIISAISDAGFGAGSVWTRIIQCIISVSIYTFGAWVVYIFKEEIEHETRVVQLS